MNDGPDFRHLVAFVAVAEECNFGKASQRIHITQPALSAQIKQLENWLGAKLFRRVPRGAELTEPGRNFLVYARRLLHLRQHAVRAASRKHSPADWPLRLGFSPFANRDLVREALVGYHEMLPEGQLSSASDSTARLLEMLSDGRLDAAIVTGPVNGRALCEHRLCEDRILLCLPDDSPFASASEVPKKAVAENLRVLFDRDHHPALHDRIMRKLKRAGIDIRPTETYSAPAEMQFLVKARKCFGLVREEVPLEHGLLAKPIEGLDLRVSTLLICNRDQQQPIVPMLAYRITRHRLMTGSLGIRKPARRQPDHNPTMVQVSGGSLPLFDVDSPV